MNPSIRRTLLFWYALILILVIGTFGGILYHQQRRAVFAGIDADVATLALALAGSVEWEADEEEHGDHAEHERAWGGGFDLEFTAVYVRRYANAEPGEPDFVVLHPDGHVMLRSAGAPEPEHPTILGRRVTDHRREITVAGPNGACVIVGCETADARGDLAGLLSAILAVGAATLLLSLAGGWFLVGRLLRPIHRMTASAERISDSNLTGRIDVGRTETELGRLAATLNSAFDRIETAFERQTRFTADASHELRTPLSIVVSNAELGLRRERTPEEHREALETCLRAAHRMTGVVEGLLVLARADAGQLEIEGAAVDLRSVLLETVEFMAPLAREHDVVVDIDAEPVTVPGDAARLADAIGNLVSNAIRYNREGGRVDITLIAEGSEAILTVKDTGVGIPQEAVERVFERFFRVDRARSRDVGGNGLGLAITRWIIEAHGGRIDLESEEDVGTTVTVRLPATALSPVSAAGPDATGGAADIGST